MHRQRVTINLCHILLIAHIECKKEERERELRVQMCFGAALWVALSRVESQMMI